MKVHPCKVVLKHEAEENLVNNRRSNISKTEQAKRSEESSESESESDIEKEDNDCCFASEVGEKNAETSSMRLRNNEEERSNSGLNNDIETCQQSKQKRTITKKDRRNARTILRKGDRIFYNDEDDWIIASIISRGGKKGGEWENYWNVKNQRTDTEIGVNLDEVEWIKEDAFAQEINFLADQITWETMVQNYELNKSAEYLKAKENEVEKWKRFNVYEEVNRSEYPNQAVISCRWVNETKERNDSTVEYKFRLVARGFQEMDPPVSDSPTAQKSVTRMCLVTCNMFNWKAESLDICAAFLQSNENRQSSVNDPTQGIQER